MRDAPRVRADGTAEPPRGEPDPLQTMRWQALSERFATRITDALADLIDTKAAEPAIRAAASGIASAVMVLEGVEVELW